MNKEDLCCAGCGDGRGWYADYGWDGTPEQLQCPCRGEATPRNPFTAKRLYAIMEGKPDPGPGLVRIF